MTAAAPQLLTTPTLHSDLRRMVRRRVPDRDVEDVVQEVLCDALARPLPASSPRDVARWVMAIAKNKVADYHRRAGRELPSDELEIGASSSVVEDRDLLGAVLREAAADPRGSETLDWLVREHEGETLGSIAAEVRLEAAAVRQRVSRFRKRLRVALLVAAALSAGGLVWWSAGALTSEPVIAEREIAIVPDAPTAAEVPSPAASTIRAGALSSLDGAWQVDAAEPAEGTSAALRAVVAAQRAITTITVSGTDVVIASPARSCSARRRRIDGSGRSPPIGEPRRSRSPTTAVAPRSPPPAALCAERSSCRAESVATPGDRVYAGAVTKILDPAEIAASFRSEIRSEIAALPEPIVLRGFLGTTGDSGAKERGPSHTYAEYTRKGCDDVGVRFDLVEVPRLEIEHAIEAANADAGVHGILVYYPVFGTEQDAYLRELVLAEKDIEGLHRFWARCLYENRRYLDAARTKKAILPCTPLAVLKLLDAAGAAVRGQARPLAGKRAVVFNRSEVVGRPLAAMLANDGATVTSFDIDGPLEFAPGADDDGHVVRETSATRASALAAADIVVTGVPSKTFPKVSGAEIREGALCVNFSTQKNFDDSILGRASVFIPRVGPMTVTMALRNTVRLYLNARTSE